MDNENKKTAFVTGGTGAIGKAIAEGIARHPEYEVILVCRNEQKGAQAVKEIVAKTGNPDIAYELVDLSRYASIQDFAKRWTKPLQVLVNNAGVTPRKRMETPEGIELQFATNVLGYFWMTQAFTEHLKRGAPSRVVNVASYWAGDLDLSDLEFKRRRYDNHTAYRQSKQANRMLTVAFAERLKPYNITVNVCHPGDVNSKLSNDLGFGGSTPPEEGARTPVWLAVDPVGAETTGKYFERMREVADPHAKDKSAIEKLYQICIRYTIEQSISRE